MADRNNNENLPPFPNIRARSAQEAVDAIEAEKQWWKNFTHAQFEIICSQCDCPSGASFRESKDAARTALCSSSDFGVRYVALYALTFLWDHDLETAEACIALLNNENDAGVRTAAIIYISSYYSGSQNQRVTNLFAKIIASDIETDIVRAVAYYGLLQIVRGEHMEGTKSIDAITFPDDIDWKVVNTYLSEDG